MERWDGVGTMGTLEEEVERIPSRPPPLERQHSDSGLCNLPPLGRRISSRHVRYLASPGTTLLPEMDRFRTRRATDAHLRVLLVLLPR